MNGMISARVITNRNLTILLKLNLNCAQPALAAEFKLISKILAGADVMWWEQIAWDCLNAADEQPLSEQELIKLTFQ